MPEETAGDYLEFLEAKRNHAPEFGFLPDAARLNPHLFPGWQDRVVAWALRKGRAAIFADCGLGKTVQQISWADEIVRHTNKPVLIVAPLAVSHQTAREGKKFGIAVRVVRRHDQIGDGVNITNYEMLDKFQPEYFSGVVIDESSRLKGDGPTRKLMTEFASVIPYRLACTATPAPNDTEELINHAEFLGVMTGSEILALWFTQDGNTTHKWRLKRHAVQDFWRWVSTWACAYRKPSDLGASDEGFVLPAISYHQHTMESPPPPGRLFQTDAKTLAEQRRARRDTIGERVAKAAELAAGTDPVLIWCGLNREGEEITKAIPGAVEIAGRHSDEHKEKALMGFIDGTHRVLVTKPEIAGFGLNLQHCSTIIFVGIGHSYEKYYQAVRRCWRFGQTKPVNVHVITSDADGLVVQNIARKEREATEMMKELVKHVGDNVDGAATKREEMPYAETMRKGDGWTIYLGDCVQQLRNVKTESVGLSIFSPPFPSMYTYTNHAADMGNCRNFAEMLAHYEFLVPELLRVLMPGRSVCVHLTQALSFLSKDGHVGMKDFRGKTIEAMERGGFHYYGEVCIDKNPQALKNGTKVLSPSGWVDVEDVAAGSSVIGSDGRPTEVLAAHPFPERPMYRVRFSDGATIDCDEGHLWTITNQSGKVEDVTTGDMLERGTWMPSGKYLRFRIPIVAPVEFAPGPVLPVHPYTLGVLLGNGNFCARGTIQFCARDETVARMQVPPGHYIHIIPNSASAKGEVNSYAICGTEWRKNEVLNSIRSLALEGKRAWEKSVPREYLFASIEDRRELLRGLLDTDGTCKKAGSVKYYTTSRQLCDDVVFLARSLGGLCRVHANAGSVYQYNGEDRQGRPIWEVVLQIDGEWNPFTTDFKGGRWEPRVRSPRRNIVEITPSGSSECTCLTVAAKDGLFVAEGFVVTHNCKAVRTKDRGLLFKSLANDSANMHMAMADYLLQFRKPGENPTPIRAGISKKYTNPDGWITSEEWIRWARPVWYGADWFPEGMDGIRETDVLNVSQARETNDERHLCPLQLGVIERAVKLWSNPGDIVLSPFAGIGSEGYKSLLLKRQFVGIELKRSYFNSACRNLEIAAMKAAQGSLFDDIEIDTTEEEFGTEGIFAD